MSSSSWHCSHRKGAEPILLGDYQVANQARGYDLSERSYGEKGRLSLKRPVFSSSPHDSVFSSSLIDFNLTQRRYQVLNLIRKLLRPWIPSLLQQV